MLAARGSFSHQQTSTTDSSWTTRNSSINQFLRQFQRILVFVTLCISLYLTLLSVYFAIVRYHLDHASFICINCSSYSFKCDIINIQELSVILWLNKSHKNWVSVRLFISVCSFKNYHKMFRTPNIHIYTLLLWVWFIETAERYWFIAQLIIYRNFGLNFELLRKDFVSFVLPILRYWLFPQVVSSYILYNIYTLTLYRYTRLLYLLS